MQLMTQVVGTHYTSPKVITHHFSYLPFIIFKNMYYLHFIIFNHFQDMVFDIIHSQCEERKLTLNPDFLENHCLSVHILITTADKQSTALNSVYWSFCSSIKSVSQIILPIYPPFDTFRSGLLYLFSEVSYFHNGQTHLKVPFRIASKFLA